MFGNKTDILVVTRTVYYIFMCGTFTYLFRYNVVRGPRTFFVSNESHILKSNMWNCYVLCAEVSRWYP